MPLPPYFPPFEYVDPGPLYKEIGRFIFEFSQLEYTIRHHVGEKAGMGDQVADMVTANIDFARLCSTMLALSAKEAGGKPEPTIEKLINECRQINEVRTRVVHGLWVAGTTNDRLIHTSRDKMTSKIFFDKPGDLDKHSERMSKLGSEITHAVYGHYYGNSA
jgi:hypothetical protein